jgi:hypothetical protein
MFCVLILFCLCLRDSEHDLVESWGRKRLAKTGTLKPMRESRVANVIRYQPRATVATAAAALWKEGILRSGKISAGRETLSSSVQCLCGMWNFLMEFS